MPKVKTDWIKYPDGWELIEPTLSELDAKMRGSWPLILIHRAHFIYLFLFFINNLSSSLFGCWKWSTWWQEKVWSSVAYFQNCASKEPLHFLPLLQKESKKISKELYESCLEQGYGDRNPIAKWKKVCVSNSFISVAAPLDSSYQWSTQQSPDIWTCICFCEMS